MFYRILLAVLLLCGHTAAAQPGPPEPPERPVLPSDPAPSGERRPTDDLRITIEPAPTEQNQRAVMIVVKHQDRTLCARPFPGDAQMALPMRDGVDVTGDGVPDAVLELFTGGAHCCYTYLILGGDDPCAPAATLNAGNSSVEIQNIDEDPSAEFLAVDWTLEYWNADFATSLSFYVILEFREEELAADTEAMRRPAPAPEELESARAAIATAWASKDDPGWQYQPRVPRAWFELAGKLVYGGNGETALALMRSTFQGTESSASDACTAFFTALSESHYWPDIARMNGWEGETPEMICAAR